jgi:para-nitrobenzyl esterase
MPDTFTKHLTVFALSIIIATGAARASRAGTDDCMDISTDKGKVSGVLNSRYGVCAYKGIPYAAPPVGPLRWAAPHEAAPWKDTLKADHFSNRCFQSHGAGSFNGDEDCLYLNIWHPAPPAKSPRPVMLFIHGGSFLHGSANAPDSEGTILASKGDVILITINYRLGVLGMMAHPALRDADGFEGNYWMLDQIAALKWTRQNVAAFGGDPQNITVFGQSAGGMSIAMLLLSPLSRDLFQKAIIESGPPFFMGMPLANQERIALEAAAKLGCPDVKTAAACLRAATPESVVTALLPTMEAHGDAVEVYDLNPVIDERLIFKDSYGMFARGEYNRNHKLMIGTCRDEAAGYAGSKRLDTPEGFDVQLHDDLDYAKKYQNITIDPNILLERYPVSKYKNARLAYIDMFTDMVYACHAVIQTRLMASNGTTVYQYEFEKEPVENGLANNKSVPHGSELPFVFGAVGDNAFILSTRKNTKISREVISLWTSFAHDGKPSAAGIPDWPAYTPESPAFLRIDTNSTVDMSLKKDTCEFYDKAIRKAYEH